MRPILSDIQNILTTASLAFATGFVFHMFGLPAPFLLGALFGIWITGAAIAPIRKRLGVPRWLHVPMILGLGTVIGSNFRPDVLAHIGSSAITVVAMVTATIIATIAGLAYLVRVRKYSFTMALLSCIPGGQAEVTAISRDFVQKDYVVALFHLVRVALVFCSTPLILAFVEGDAAVIRSNDALARMAGIADIDLNSMLLFLMISIFSLPVAILVRLPMPHLLGPLLISSTFHILGLVEIPRISEFVIVAQIVIGASVGARLACVPFRELAMYIRDAIVNSAIVLSTYGVVAYCLALLTGIDFIKMLLAFVPGGLYEVTLLALIFGFDIAFVAFHHTIRVMMVFLGLPFIITFAERRNLINRNIKSPH